MPPHTPRHHLLAVLILFACKDEDDDGSESTSEVGTFDGLFDEVGVGLNFPFDIGIVPDDPSTIEDVEGGDILVADYGTSQILRVPNPSGETGVAAEPFFDGTSVGLGGAMGVSIAVDQLVFAAFEQGGEADAGAIVVLDQDGVLVDSIDGAVDASAFARPGGICLADDDGPEAHAVFFVNMGDGTAWRVGLADPGSGDFELTQVGSGLATGSAGNPGSPGNGLTSSNGLPEGGARGCAHADGRLYVADAQNARIVRFDEATGLEAVALEDTPAELVTWPTDVAINGEGHLIVISYDNAHAFVSLELPSGGFIDNGLHDLNVNAGNYGVALAHDTIWFTRANNSNGALRALTPDQDTPPTTEGPFPPQ